MHRRHFVGLGLVGIASLATASTGCRKKQFARVVQPGESEMIGSHAAGTETFKPLVEESVAKLLARHCDHAAQVSYQGEFAPAVKSVCFVGIENKSAEEIGDFKEQLYQLIDTKIIDSQVFQSISRRYVDAGLRAARLRPDDLMLPDHQRTFASIMEQQGSPFDYLLFATLTSGTTRENKEMQRDYLLTLELVDIRTGIPDKQSAEISKGYHQSRVSRWSATNPFGW
jgi:hypothetical protein